MDPPSPITTPKRPWNDPRTSPERPRNDTRWPPGIPQFFRETKKGRKNQFGAIFEWKDSRCQNSSNKKKEEDKCILGLGSKIGFIIRGGVSRRMDVAISRLCIDPRSSGRDPEMAMLTLRLRSWPSVGGRSRLVGVGGSLSGSKLEVAGSPRLQEPPPPARPPVPGCPWWYNHYHHHHHRHCHIMLKASPSTWWGHLNE